MPNDNWISAQDQQAIIDAANKLFFVEENRDAPGHYTIQMQTDYRDDSDFLLQTAYDNRGNAEDIIPSLTEEICSGWDAPAYDIASDIMREAGFDLEDDAFERQREWFYGAFSIEAPIDHYLDQDMKVNIMLSTPQDRQEDDSMPFMLREALMHFTGAGGLTRDLGLEKHLQDALFIEVGELHDMGKEVVVAVGVEHVIDLILRIVLENHVGVAGRIEILFGIHLIYLDKLPFHAVLGGRATMLEKSIVRQDPLVLIVFLTIGHSVYRPFSGLGTVLSGFCSVRFSAALICSARDLVFSPSTGPKPRSFIGFSCTSSGSRLSMI